MYACFNRDYLRTHPQSWTGMWCVVHSVIFSQKMVLVTWMPEPPYRISGQCVYIFFWAPLYKLHVSRNCSSAATLDCKRSTCLFTKLKFWYQTQWGPQFLQCNFYVGFVPSIVCHCNQRHLKIACLKLGEHFVKLVALSHIFMHQGSWPQFLGYFSSYNFIHSCVSGHRVWSSESLHIIESCVRLFWLGGWINCRKLSDSHIA